MRYSRGQAEDLGRRSHPASLTLAGCTSLEIDIRQRLAVVVADDEAGVQFLGRLGRREAAGSRKSPGRWKSNVARRYKANNPVRIAARQISLWCALIPDDRLTNGIFGFDYRLWRYRIPLPFDGNPILTLADVVASAVTISVRATHNPFGGPHVLKPLTYFRRDVITSPTLNASQRNHSVFDVDQCADCDRLSG
jgi:hypothetical protein